MRAYEILIIIVIVCCCGGTRDDIVFEAFTEPFLDWYSLKLYSNGEFDMHVPSIDYSGKYYLSGDTIYLESFENEHRTMTTTVNGQRVVDTIAQQSWTFFIDRKTNRIRTGEKDSARIVIDILMNNLP